MVYLEHAIGIEYYAVQTEQSCIALQHAMRACAYLNCISGWDLISILNLILILTSVVIIFLILIIIAVGLNVSVFQGMHLSITPHVNEAECINAYMWW